MGGHDILLCERKEKLQRTPQQDFTGRELYFLDPSGNLLEVRDPSWTAGMPTPSLVDIVGDGSRP